MRIGYLGPPGTFSEEAVLTQPDLADQELVALATLPDVLAAVEDGSVELGFVPIENSIEGSVLLTLDSLVFEHELLIQREVVMPVHLQLLGPAGMTLPSVERVVAFPFAASQCRGFMAKNLPGVEVVPASSNADAVVRAAEDGRPGTAALGTVLAARLYGMEVVAAAVEDHPDNATRFVAVATSGIPAPTGHDRTSIACFQHADRPGSLHAILGQFSARSINLTKLESRPTKKQLGDYCFIIDLEGHIDDEVVADCLRDLHAQLKDVKFLGSYPATGEHSESIRRDAAASWRAADDWITGIRG
ncbi:MAG TPA: prephenate dehydratase, partial [Acidimicrobiales bacterium]|nr:prephenate dehydratase [Acidimicrobiales bacterium]